MHSGTGDAWLWERRRCGRLPPSWSQGSSSRLPKKLHAGLRRCHGAPCTAGNIGIHQTRETFGRPSVAATIPLVLGAPCITACTHSAAVASTALASLLLPVSASCMEPPSVLAHHKTPSCRDSLCLRHLEPRACQEKLKRAAYAYLHKEVISLSLRTL